MSDRPAAPLPDDAALESALRDVLDERGRATNGDVRAVLDTVPDLPERGGGRRGSLLAAAAAVGLLVIGGVLAVGQLSPSRVASEPGRLGRAAFVDDPRLAACEATTGPAAQVFEMTYAEWFPLYFPGWWKGAPELEVTDPALVVIGHEMVGGFLGRPPLDSGSPEPTRPPAFQMCIAVGPPDAATTYQYGPTWFDRIVPVLSEADIARAAHLDPDVLGDPTAWAFPERLAPCGGVTGNELSVFEANPLSDFPRYFPHADPVPPLDVDLPGIVVVYRDPLAVPRPLKPGAPNPNAHDVCVILEADNAQPDHELLLDVDTTGFHLRIDMDQPIASSEPSTEPTGEPSEPAITPAPAPAWAGNAASALECLGSPRVRVGLGPADTGSGEDPDQALSIALSSIRSFDPGLPDGGYLAAADDPAARLYVRRSGGRIVAAIAIVTAHPGSTREWVIGSVAACEPSEFDPSVTTGQYPFGIWVDAVGNEVPSSLLRASEDCYGGTQIHFDGRLYVRIPNGGVDESQLEVTWRADMTLPATAIDTGYRSGDLRLFQAASGKALYVANGDRAERLPHVIGDEVIRTDCN
jgi:hypothetical protein